MNSKNVIRKVGGLLLAIALVLGVAMMSGTAVQAQRGFHGGGAFHGGGFRGRGFIGPRLGYPYGYYGYWGYPYSYYSPYVFSNSGDAESQGYHDGLKTGSNDERRRQSYDPERSHYFKNAGFGNFAEDYRAGFTRGYDEGFKR